ncbi:MAG: MFS transporter [Chloroflexi bacterium]|nr:MFS transporter [Chloroflexota bacterium]
MERRVISPYVTILRNPQYVPLWLGQLVSSFGDTLHYVALVVLVYNLTGSGLAVSSVVAAEVVPVLLLGPIAGVVVDRISRQRILIAADLWRAALVATLIVPQGTWQAYAVAAGVAAGGVFFNPTVQAIIPAITSEEERLAANSVNWSTGRLVQIVGSALAGGLIAFVGTAPAFGLNALSFLFSAAVIARMRIPPHAGLVPDAAKRGLGGYVQDAREGLAFARRDPLLSRYLPVQALAALSVGATSALLVVLAQQHLGLPPAGFGWLLGAIGVGALLGPFFIGAIVRDYRQARWLFGPYVIRGVGDVLIAAFSSVPLALGLLFVYGLCTSSGMVASNTILQTSIPDRVRGRSFTLLDVTWNLMRLLSLGLGGLLVDLVGVRAVYCIGGSLLVVAGLLGLTLFRGSCVLPSDSR